VTFGTLFTNLTPILFDWNVQTAFLTNDLPNIDASNPMLSNSIYNLAIALFPRYKDELQNFIVRVKEKLLHELKDEMTIVGFERRKTFLNRIFPIYVASTPIMLYIVMTVFDNYIFEFMSTNTFLLISFLMMSISMAAMWIILNKQKDTNDREKRFELRKERAKLENEIVQLNSLSVQRNPEYQRKE